jgi:hypothetical protein
VQQVDRVDALAVDEHVASAVKSRVQAAVIVQLDHRPLAAGAVELVAVRAHAATEQDRAVREQLDRRGRDLVDGQPGQHRRMQRERTARTEARVRHAVGAEPPDVDRYDLPAQAGVVHPARLHVVSASHRVDREWLAAVRARADVVDRDGRAAGGAVGRVEHAVEVEAVHAAAGRADRRVAREQQKLIVWHRPGADDRCALSAGIEHSVGAEGQVLFAGVRALARIDDASVPIAVTVTVAIPVAIAIAIAVAVAVAVAGLEPAVIEARVAAVIGGIATPDGGDSQS